MAVEEKEQQNKKLKVITIILAVLFAVSVAVLAGILLNNYFSAGEPASVKVSDNIIMPEKEDDTNLSENKEESSAPSLSEKNAAIVLHTRRSGENRLFQVGNMFPGDCETRYYRIKAAYKDDIIVRFHAAIRPGYEKLAEVLKVKINLPEKEEILYDGLMRDMPQSLKYPLKTDTSTESELYYEVTAYLEPSVGNEYQNQKLVADFRWWVEETDHLESLKTGDASNIYLWMCLAAGSLLLLIILGKQRRGAVTNER